MQHLLILAGALIAAPLAAQMPKMADPAGGKSGLEWFLLTETRAEVTAAMGSPVLVADFGSGMQSWQYQVGDIDHHEFSHQFVFAGPEKTLISVTRNYEPELSVDQFFPARETTVHQYPDSGAPQYSLRLRRLPGGRVLMAMGSSRPGQVTGQLVLMRESSLEVFYPWLAVQLNRLKP